VWCGCDALSAVVSPRPKEGMWYSASLQRIEVSSGRSSDLYTPEDQVGLPSASHNGEQVVFIEGVCSDRGIVAGDLQLIDVASCSVRRLDVHHVDVTHVEWRSERHLLLAGHRGLETVIGIYDLTRGTFAETWRSQDMTTGGRYASVSGLNQFGDCVLVGESYLRVPEIAVIHQGTYQSISSLGSSHGIRSIADSSIEPLSWNAPDGLEVQGWLLQPAMRGPLPLVMNLHGGPVWHWRPTWLGRSLGVPVMLLLSRGYAVFMPNPRGSSGRGREFARRVVGDMGGADTYDCLSGLDYLVDRGVADRRRLGVTGGSYGGFMTSWLVTQDPRFAAAVSLAPVTNRVSQHLLCAHSHFVEMFLADRFDNPSGRYFHRSPITFADRVTTPMLNIAGELDRCTPPGEAVQFHRALIESGRTSVLVMYPEEGHGIRRMPAAIDYAARVSAWFDKYMPGDANSPC